MQRTTYTCHATYDVHLSRNVRRSVGESRSVLFAERLCNAVADHGPLGALHRLRARSGGHAPRRHSQEGTPAPMPCVRRPCTAPAEMCTANPWRRADGLPAGRSGVLGPGAGQYGGAEPDPLRPDGSGTQVLLELDKAELYAARALRGPPRPRASLAPLVPRPRLLSAPTFWAVEIGLVLLRTISRARACTRVHAADGCGGLAAAACFRTRT